MSRYIFTIFFIIGLLSCGGDGQQYFADNAHTVFPAATLDKADPNIKKDIKARYVQGEVLVKFKEGTDANKIYAMHKALSINTIKKIGVTGAQHIRIPENTSVEEVIQFYETDPDVEYAEPNYIVKKAVIPDDPGFINQWGLNNTGQTGGLINADINAIEAWDVTTGSESVIIAVIDSGVAYNHPDLAGNIWVNTLEQNGYPGIDDDRNGYVDDVYGWDFIDNDGYPEDLNSHGTHVAGTIAAKGDNGLGIAGVMWSAKIMPVRFLGVSGTGDTASAAKAIIYAADNGARVINASWAGDGDSKTLYNAIDYARNKGILFVAASGNDANNNDIYPSYPAGYDLPNIISVAATDYKDNLAFFSNYGKNSVHLASPGVSIYSSIPIFVYGTPVIVYSGNFDGKSGDLPLLGWDRGGINSTWAVTAKTGVGGTNSLEDSPGGNYLPNTNSWAGYMTPFTSARNNLYTLSFQWKGYVNPLALDYLKINYSPDGINWDWADWTDGYTAGKFITFSTDAITEVSDLLNSFYFGFGLESSFSSSYDGVYIDDVILKRRNVDISDYTYTSYNWSGTSMAASYVSGVAGLILSVNPSLSYEEVKDIILKSVDVIPSHTGMTITGGRLNALNAVSNIAPPAPSDLIAAAVTSSQINLLWVDSSVNEAGFKIERKTGVEGTYTEIATTGENVTFYSDTGLTANTTYYYRVKAYNAAGDSRYSNEAGATTMGTSSSGKGGGGGCSICKVNNHQTKVANTIIFLIPLVVVWILKRFRKR
ncbi:MAG: S8 family serine peptidase [Nitrospirae bacterium]|nr:S8 family serine peptidase [Nitrospirota bacterium]